mgnify:CR=1 FL=1
MLFLLSLIRLKGSTYNACSVDSNSNSGNRKRPSGSPAGKSTNSAKNVRSGKAKPSGSPAAKPKKIPGQTTIPNKGKGSGLGTGKKPQGSSPAKPKGSQVTSIRTQAAAKQAVKKAAARDANKASNIKKKAVAARNAKVTKAAPYAAAGAVAAGAGGMTMAARREKQQKAKSGEKGLVWNGNAFVKKK